MKNEIGNQRGEINISIRRNKHIELQQKNTPKKVKSCKENVNREIKYEEKSRKKLGLDLLQNRKSQMEPLDETL